MKNKMLVLEGLFLAIFPIMKSSTLSFRIRSTLCWKPWKVEKVSRALNPRLPDGGVQHKTGSQWGFLTLMFENTWAIKLVVRIIHKMSYVTFVESRLLFIRGKKNKEMCILKLNPAWTDTLQKMTCW